MSCTVCESGGDNVGDGTVLGNSVDVGDTVSDEDKSEGEEVESPDLLAVPETSGPRGTNERVMLVEAGDEGTRVEAGKGEETEIMEKPARGRETTKPTQ